MLFLSPAVRGVGFQTGDAAFRRLVSDEASVLMHTFEGLDVNAVPPRWATTAQVSTRIGRRLHAMANRNAEQPDRIGASPQPHRQGTTRRHESADGDNLFGTSSRADQQDTAGPSHGDTTLDFQGAFDTFGAGPSTMFQSPSYLFDVPSFQHSPIRYTEYSEPYYPTIDEFATAQQEGDDDARQQPRRRQRLRARRIPPACLQKHGTPVS